MALHAGGIHLSLEAALFGLSGFSTGALRHGAGLENFRFGTVQPLATLGLVGPCRLQLPPHPLLQGQQLRQGVAQGRGLVHLVVSRLGGLLLLPVLQVQRMQALKMGLQPLGIAPRCRPLPRTRVSNLGGPGLQKGPQFGACHGMALFTVR
jgi:hypothetical protein